MKAKVIGMVAAMLLAAAGAVQAGPVVFADDTFNSSDWSLTTILFGGGGAASVSKATSGGNPGSYCSYTHTITPTVSSSALVDVFHIRNDAVYDPATQGAIAFVAYSEDTFTKSLGWGMQVGGGLALNQGGIFYYGGYRIDATLSWTTHTYTSLTASDFYVASDFYITGGGGSSHPDFSSSGAPIAFGFLRATSEPAGHNWVAKIAGGTDNWEVTITPVPEPAALSLVTLVGLALLRRRRR